jgi:hypothetical protein
MTVLRTQAIPGMPSPVLELREYEDGLAFWAVVFPDGSHCDSVGWSSAEEATEWVLAGMPNAPNLGDPAPDSAE